MISVLRQYNYRLWATADLISVTGTWMQVLGVNWYLLQATGSPARMGLGIVLQALPALLIGPYAGALADRIRPRPLLIATQVAHAGPDHPEPGGDDFRLDIAMVPRKTRQLRDTWRGAVRGAVEEEVVGIGEERERGRASWIRRDHMERLHLHCVGHELGDGVGVPCDRVDGGKQARRSLEAACNRSFASRLPG